MTTYTIYHNPRCSKSRQTLALLEQNGIEPTIILYLKTPPSTQDISLCLSALGLTPRQLLRTKEDDYKVLNLSNSELSDAQLLQAMVDHPKLIERPIVIKHSEHTQTAVLGRPPENVLQLFNAKP